MTQKKNIKLLLAEDEVDAAESITKLLIRNGFDVVGTRSGRQAVELVRSEDFDLILLDIFLEEMTGLRALEEIRIFNNKVKVVIVTGSALMAEDREKVCLLGVHEFVSKPCNFEQLLQAIDSGLKNEEHLPLSEFPQFQIPQWHFQPQEKVNQRHELKGILGALNMQCSNFLLEMDLTKGKDLGNIQREEHILGQLKDIHLKIKKACQVIHEEITS